jgi:hypothetical protein
VSWETFLWVAAGIIAYIVVVLAVVALAGANRKGDLYVRGWENRQRRTEQEEVGHG